ncbi:epoxyqueuosine reductase [Thermodesulfobacteriota bacterium]
MLSRTEIIEKAYELGFDEIGFTTAEPFESQKEALLERKEEYAHLSTDFDLIGGTNPKNILPEAKSIIVLVAMYLKESFPPVMEAHFGRLYIDEDRIIKQELVRRTKDFVTLLREDGMKAKASYHLPHRACAGRAGIGNVGKNCLLYSSKAGYENSWLIPATILVDREYDPDEPKDENVFDCPDWCKNACIVSCPTRALKGPRKLDPRRCISNMTYLATEITPLEMREAMGLWVYGCDRCQNVCPRNDAWRAKERPVNERAAAKAADFALSSLLHMDKEYFETRIWPHMFYILPENMWLWKMNVARVMGNTRDRKYIPDLIRAFKENEDERVKGIIAWSLGRLGGEKAKSALEDFLKGSEGLVQKEIKQSLEVF